MIAVARVQDQELTVGPERPRIEHFPSDGAVTMAPDCVATMSPCITPPLPSSSPKRRLRSGLLTGNETCLQLARTVPIRRADCLPARAARPARPRASDAPPAWRRAFPRPCARPPIVLLQARRSSPSGCRPWRASLPPWRSPATTRPRCSVLQPLLFGEQQAQPLLFRHLLPDRLASAAARSASIEAVTRAVPRGRRAVPRSAAQFGHHRAEQDGAAHRRQRVLRLDQRAPAAG